MHFGEKRAFGLKELLAIIVAIWAVLPSVQYGTINRLIVSIAGALWFLTTYIKCIKRAGSYTSLIMTFVVLFLIMAILIEYFSSNSFESAFNGQLQNIIFLLILCIGVYYLEYNPYFLMSSFWLLILLVTITSFLTLRQGLLTPGISRQMVWSQEVARNYAKQGVGGYGTVYSAVFVASALLFMFGQIEKSRKRKYLLLLPILIMALMVFSSGYLISTILFSTMLISFIFGVHKRQNIGSIFITIGLIMGVLCVVIDLVFIKNSDTVVGIFTGTLYETKIREIILFLQSNELTGKTEGRYVRYVEAITALFKFPILGATLVGRQEELGGHSQLLDMFGRYGLFSIGYYYALIKTKSIFYKVFNAKGYLFLISMLFILNGILNTYSYAHAVAIFMLVPAAILMTDKEMM